MKNLNSMLPPEERIIYGPKNELILLGLLWQPIEKELSSSEIIHRVKKFSCDYYIVSNGQIGGFVYNSEENLNNCYCGAYLFGEFFDGKGSLCLLKMEENTYWVLGIYNEKIIPGADNCFQSLEEARSRFEILSCYFKWKLFIISSEIIKLINIDIQDDVLLKEVNVSEIIKQLNFVKSYKVNSIYLSNWVNNSANIIVKKIGFKITVPILFLIIVAYLSVKYFLYYKRKEQEIILRDLARISLIEERNKWKKQPSLASAIKIIDIEINKLPIIIAGWKLDYGSLNSNTLSVTYKPQNSDNFDYFSKQIKKIGFECLYDSKKNVAVISKTCKVDNIPEETVLSEIIISNNKIKSILSGKFKVNGYIKPIVNSNTGVSSFDFSFQSTLSPSTLFGDKDLQCATSREIGFVLNKNNITWKIVGKCYGKK